MKHMYVNLILGYGIPKDITADDNYRTYLLTVFNVLYTKTLHQKDRSTVVILSGGNSDVVKPFQRTEAEEMLRFLKPLASRFFCRPITKHWKFVLEKKSLSSLENFIYSRAIIKAKRFSVDILTIFCEHTHRQRVQILAKKFFTKIDVRVIGIDFDISANRYLDPAFLAKKERKAIEVEAWALKHPRNFKKYCDIHVERIQLLRKAGIDRHVDAVREWWEQKMKDIEKEMRKK